jgi:hypothetical protein
MMSQDNLVAHRDAGKAGKLPSNVDVFFLLSMHATWRESTRYDQKRISSLDVTVTLR